MKYSRLIIVCITFCGLSSGCGIVTPSHHAVDQYTVTFAAATGGNLAAVQDAVQNDPTLVKAREWNNATLLHDAVGQNHFDVAQYLLEKGADVNATTSDGITPLHMVAQNGNIAILTLLLSHGAKVNAIDAKGWSPLDRAEKWNHADAASFLKKHGGHEGTAG